MGVSINRIMRVGILHKRRGSLERFMLQATELERLVHITLRLSMMMVRVLSGLAGGARRYVFRRL